MASPDRDIVIFEPGPERLVVDEGLVLERTCADDGPRAYAYVDTQREHYGKYLDYAAKYRPEDAEASYSKAQPDIDSGKLLNYWMIATDETDETDETVGSVGMRLYESGVAELGYAVFEEAQGREYAPRGSRALLKLAAQRGIRLVEMHIKPANKRSIRVAQKLGAVFMSEQLEERGGYTAVHQTWGVRING